MLPSQFTAYLQRYQYLNISFLIYLVAFIPCIALKASSHTLFFTSGAIGTISGVRTYKLRHNNPFELRNKSRDMLHIQFWWIPK
jgi:hypothetical protein